jgi:hypothetical protein
MRILYVLLAMSLIVGLFGGCGISNKSVVSIMREGTLDIYQPEAAYGYRGVNLAISGEVFSFPEAETYVLDDNLNRVNPILGKYYYLYQVTQLGQAKYVLSQHKYSDGELE